MTDERCMGGNGFLIYGAGAIGSALGGVLARAGQAVTLCARAGHVEAIKAQSGLRLRGWEESWLQPIDAVTGLDGIDPSMDWTVVLAVKSYDTPAALEDIARTLPPETPIVCMQNSVANEEIAARRFGYVYGGVFKMTCAMLEPGGVLFRRLGQIVVGLHPAGRDRTSEKIVERLCQAGFRGELSENIVSEKWHKLLINLNSATHAIIRATPETSREMARIRTAIVREGHEALTAAGIEHEATVPGSETIAEMLHKLEKSSPPSANPQPFLVHNGTWQNLHLQRPHLENGLYHETIINLGKEHGVPTPYNQAIWLLLQRAHAEGLGAECFGTGDVVELVTGLMNK